MKIYVAAPFALWRDVRVIHGKLRDLGHTITHDWTKCATATGEPKVTPEVAERHANEDLKGVADADLVILLATDEHPGCGCYYEAGYADRAGIPIIVVGRKQHIFWTRAVQHIPHIQYLWPLVSNDQEVTAT